MNYRVYILVFIFTIILLPAESCSLSNTVVIIIDGLGSSYIYPERTAYYADGGLIDPVELISLQNAQAKYELKAPVPKTEIGHAVLVTGYSEATSEVVSYYDATIFDAAKKNGYINIAIMEKGDSDEILGEQDIAVREKNNSVFKPLVEYVENGGNVPVELSYFMKGYPYLDNVRPGKDPYFAYVRYNSWALQFGADVVAFMNETLQDQKYLLTINAGGLDSAGHSLGSDGYRAVISGMDIDIQRLVDICKKTDTILIITGDHGMSFKHESSKGSHSSFEVCSRDESVLVPFIVCSGGASPCIGNKPYGQECFAPAILSLMGCPDTLSLSDGEKIPVLKSPSIFINSRRPVEITVTGQDYSNTAIVEGIHRFGPLEKGIYTIRYGDGPIVIDLASDELIDLDKVNTAEYIESPLPDYLIPAIFSGIGIFIALLVIRKRK
ncbi:arylsulfatase [Methanocella sp. CWC-04]|uniref:Arylsulfatase n=1 Tax=Methanooceanicella nereidis TaxID=2052831 RepID=A0AAP2REM2_9EURY|nr:alkaline phosphatase family protein [Methanocella sp. CWC-04]MCD1295130.1 arylsulfatase [Methanocella sp. CWC-04]